MSTLRPPPGERDHFRGRLNAPLQLVEFGDFQCPFSGRAYPVVQAIDEALGDRLCFAFRNFPLAPGHPHALQAAEAAEAAGAQGRYWEMHALLFENQVALELPDLVEYAATLKLDLERFADELGTHTHLAKIRQDLRSGGISGVNGTPTFFVNGVRHDESFDFDSLVEALTAAPALGHEI